jgi:hypothetical protein
MEKLHNEELHNLLSFPHIIGQIKTRKMRWASHVADMGEEIKLYKVLVRKPEGKMSLGRRRRRWEDGIRIYISEDWLGWGVEWIKLAQNSGRWRTVVNATMNLRVVAERSE